MIVVPVKGKRRLLAGKYQKVTGSSAKRTDIQGTGDGAFRCRCGHAHSHSHSHSHSFSFAVMVLRRSPSESRKKITGRI